MGNDLTKRAGYYGCLTGVTPFGFGGGLCADHDGNIYMQLATGTPGVSASFGAASDLDEALTGTSINVAGKRFGMGANPTSVAGGMGFGSPGIGATYGFKPFNVRDLGKLPALYDSNEVAPIDPIYQRP